MNREYPGNDEAARRQLASLTAASRAFTVSMRASAAERERMREERIRLLEREREARAEAEASRRQIANILESISDAFFALDDEWCLTYVNRKAEQLWGRRREDLLGRNIWKEFPQAVDSESFRQIKRAKEEGVTTEFETVSPVLGSWISGRAYPSPDGLTVYFHDITESKNIQEERDRLRARELTVRAQTEERRRISRELHDRVAHDIALVHQNLELYEALKTSDPRKAAARIEIARKTTREALDRTRNLSMELRRLEVRRSLESALSNLLRDMVPPNIRVGLSVKGDEAPVPPEARDQLFLILREAIRNAVAHSGCGRLTVELDVAPEMIEGAVEDDGQGFSVEAARSSADGGLKSMEERTVLLGGTLDVTSVPGKGTRLAVSVPLGEHDV